MELVVLLLLVLALVLFLLAAAGIPTARWSLGWVGLAVLTIVFILQNWPGHVGS